MPFLKIQNNVLIPVASTHCSTQYLSRYRVIQHRQYTLPRIFRVCSARSEHGTARTNCQTAVPAPLPAYLVSFLFLSGVYPSG